MGNAFIQVPPQSTGLKVQTFENTVSANTVEAEAVVLVRSSDNTEVGSSAQPLYVQEPTLDACIASNIVAVHDSGNVAVTNAGLSNLDVALSTRTKPADQQHAIIDSGTVTTVSTVTAVTSITNPVSTKTALTVSAPAAATVGVTSAQALASNSNRKGLVLTNTSANTISLGIGSAAVLNSGITLNPSGGTWVMDEFTFATGAINAIASAASSNLAIQEFTT